MCGKRERYKETYSKANAHPSRSGHVKYVRAEARRGGEGRGGERGGRVSKRLTGRQESETETRRESERERERERGAASFHGSEFHIIWEFQKARMPKYRPNLVGS